MEYILQARDLHKAFGKGQQQTPILRGIGLDLEPAEVVFLVGPSGSGKTTLLSILGCILSPDQGNVAILGREVSELGAEKRTSFRGKNLGFVFQSFNLFPTLSAQDNLCLALTMREMPLTAAMRRATQLLQQVGLGNRSRLRPAQLSTGECQRVAVARALANDPAIIFADEPTASLDAENGQVVMQLFTSLVRDRGTSLVVVTHDERIFPFADRILRLENGYLKSEWKSAGFMYPAAVSVAHLPGLVEEHVA